MADAVSSIGAKRPTYGTRLMAAQVSRETSVPVNRKQIPRIYRKTGYINPQKTNYIRTKRRLFKPDAPSRLWDLDITYIWCDMDGWCYSFNVADCFTRKWIAYAFDTNATRHMTINSVTNAVATEKPDCSRLRIHTDNGDQCANHDFRKAIQALGINKHEFIWY